MVPESSDDSSGEDEWRFSLDDLSNEGDDVSGDDGTATEDDDARSGDGSIFGPRPDEGGTEVRPGSPDPENVLFVALGVATTLLIVLQLLGLF